MSKEGSSPDINPVLRYSYRKISSLLDSSFQIRVFEQDRRKEIDELLYDHSLIVPFNHPSVFDPIAVARELRTSFPDVPRILLPASKKFYDGRMGKPAKVGMDYFAEKYAVTMIPVIQDYDKNYSDSNKRKSYIDLLQEVYDALQTPGNIVMIAPEGTRSIDGQMGKAKSGITKMMQKFPESMVCPISLYGTEEVLGRNQYMLNPIQSGNLVYGNPVKSGDILCAAEEMNITANDLVMYQIALHLPERYRGCYES